ncbi:MAG: CorA family divalent cation transporter [Pseudomonadota bacterium]
MDTWPSPIGDSCEFRWLHFDVADKNFAEWAHAMLPPIAAKALVQSETRPRCERLDSGIVLNLRGVNLNPEASPEDMVSLRLWIASGNVVSARVRKVFAADTMRETGSGKG